MTSSRSEPPVVGLIPAAGRATRLGPLPSSKELLPVGFRRLGQRNVPRVACHDLLEKLRGAGVERAFLVLRRGKGDVADYLADGRQLGIRLAYVVVGSSGSVPETLEAAYPFVADRTVVFGFPDVLLEPPDAYGRLLAHLRTTGADLALGLFPAGRPETTDMVALADDGAIRDIEVRPEATTLTFNWLIAAWRPPLTAFVHAQLADGVPAPRHAGGELQLGELFRRALGAGLRVVGLPFPAGSYQDLGTPEGLASAWRRVRLGTAGEAEP